jgi:hypothetical protein
MEKGKELLKILDSFIKVGEASKQTPAGKDNRLLDAEGLGFKIFSHASAILYLSRSTNIPDSSIININFFDAASINVLGRAAIESFLVFQYIFINNNDSEHEDFHYLSWVLGGLIERQRLPAYSPQGKKVLENERKTILSLEPRLKTNKYFLKLTENQRTNLLTKGNWRLKTWSEVGLESGLSDSYAKAFYSYLCGYAHASNLSVLQLRQAKTTNAQMDLYEATIGYLLIALSKFIKSYIIVFPKAKSIYDSLADKMIIEVWDSVGSKSLSDVQVDWTDFDI